MGTGRSAESVATSRSTGPERFGAVAPRNSSRKPRGERHRHPTARADDKPVDGPVLEQVRSAGASIDDRQSDLRASNPPRSDPNDPGAPSDDSGRSNAGQCCDLNESHTGPGRELTGPVAGGYRRDSSDSDAGSGEDLDELEIRQCGDLNEPSAGQRRELTGPVAGGYRRDSTDSDAGSGEDLGELDTRQCGDLNELGAGQRRGGKGSVGGGHRRALNGSAAGRRGDRDDSDAGQRGARNGSNARRGGGPGNSGIRECRDLDDRAEELGLWDLDEMPAEDLEPGEVVAPGWLRQAQPQSSPWDRLIPSRFRGARVDPGRRGVLTFAAVGILALAIATVVILRERPVAQPVPPLPALRTATIAAPSAAAGSPVEDRPNTPAPTAANELVVSVVGLVHRPGLVRLPNGSRVADALAAAGGSTPDADLAGLNLAQRLLDSDQVMVGPARNATPGTPQLGSGTINSADRNPTTPAVAAGAPTPATRINLNTATEPELDALPGVGPVTARAIVTWRSTNGSFTDIAQLAEVDGIGPARLARLRDLVRI
ncbi:helix-hairpin-helix domain-containing protein [Nocardia sp. NPDC050712]|uniref:helix-hairpin-helix domain-containing protein n=1 Tax=Nocardia sp. NPDC050712 TaxID=3155518 RepID=UPI0033EA0020